MIAVVKEELLDQWQAQLPVDTPNYFLFNIQTSDVPAIEQFLAQRGIASSDAYALVRARLAQINSVDVNQLSFTDPRASHTVNHTFNITYTNDLPEQNSIVSGEWLNASDDVAQLSIETGIAQRLELELGDELTLTVGSQRVKARVSSLRSVVWENFKPNFYIIAKPELIESMPQAWLLSALITETNHAALKELLKRYPSITLLDVTEVMGRVRAMSQKATVALEFFFVFALGSALLVLAASIQTGRHEREIESSLLRALGARTHQLYRVNVLEFTLMGAPIGFFSASFASVAAWVISEYFFGIDFSFSPLVWVYGMLPACIILTLVGTLVSRRVYHVSPMMTLRS